MTPEPGLIFWLTELYDYFAPCRPGAPKPLLGVVKVKPVAAARPARPAPTTAEQPAKRQRTDLPLATTAAESEEDGDDGGLPGLIGAYGSDSEEDANSQEQPPDSGGPAQNAGSGGGDHAEAVINAASADASQKHSSVQNAAETHCQDADELDYE